jgi:hypothetical protein
MEPTLAKTTRMKRVHSLEDLRNTKRSSQDENTDTTVLSFSQPIPRHKGKDKKFEKFGNIKSKVQDGSESVRSNNVMSKTDGQGGTAIVTVGDTIALGAAAGQNDGIPTMGIDTTGVAEGGIGLTSAAGGDDGVASHGLGTSVLAGESDGSDTNDVRKAGPKTVGQGATCAAIAFSETGKSIPTANVFEICVSCKNPCQGSEGLTCYLCDDFYHPDCGGLDKFFVANNARFIRALGWSCDQCKLDLRKILGNFRSVVCPEQVIDRVGTVQNTRITTDSTAIQSSQGSASMAGENIAASHSGLANNLRNRPMMQEDVERVVRKTVNDASRRKRNIIVSGLKEEQNGDDEKMFLLLCENHLGLKPRVESNGTLRLGKESTVSSQRHRRLLVRFSSEQTASDLLLAARDLRFSTDPYVANNIYFNRDLSREESKAAFNKRQIRRTARAAGNQSGEPGVGMEFTEVAEEPTVNRPGDVNLHAQHSRIIVNSHLNRNSNPNRGASASNRSNLIVCGNNRSKASNVNTSYWHTSSLMDAGYPRVTNRFGVLDAESQEFVPASVRSILDNGSTADDMFIGESHQA